MSDPVVLEHGAATTPTTPGGGRSAHRARQALAVFGGYAVASIVLFGFPMLRDPTHRFVGSRIWPDPDFFLWALAWWPHAVAHGLNPMWTHVVWAPAGYNLAWATGAPGPALILSPLTAVAGPVASYNLLALSAPPLAAWSAYLLCRQVTGRFWPSVMGGYVFGFSTYLVAHIGMHVNLELVFVAPLCCYFVLRRLEGSVSARRFVAVITLLLTLQFLISTEVFATVTLSGLACLGIAVAFGPSSGRGNLVGTLRLCGLSLVLTAALVSPYLYYLFAFGVPHRFLSGSDLLSLVLPRGRTLVGSHLLSPITRRFPGSPTEDTIYLGPALLAVLVHFAVSRWREVGSRVLSLGLVAFWVAVLGPTLSVNGHSTIDLPWAAVRRLPLLSNLAPRRLSMYVFLAAAVVLALWLSQPGRSRWRWPVALLIPVFLFPSNSPVFLAGSERVPRFFSSGTYRRYIAPGETILLIPAQTRGAFIYPDSMDIQARTGFAFRLLVGYTGPFPPEFQNSRILQAIYAGTLRGIDPVAVRTLLLDHGVRHVLVGLGSPFGADWTAILGPPRPVMDVLVYPVIG